jgi:hypothetical protein
MTDRDRQGFLARLKGVFGRRATQPAAAANTATPAGSPKPKSPSRAERRHQPRISVMSMLGGYGVEQDVKVTIREVSAGGFSVESVEPFPVGGEQTFLFSTNDGRETLVRAVCRHANMTEIRGTRVCVAGFQFADQPAEHLAIITETIDRLVAKGAKPWQE